MKGICANEFEFKFWQDNRYVLGVDEAGRGPLAGPLVVAGVVFEQGYVNELIYDSKALSEKKREALFQQIIRDAKSYCIEIKTAQEIDASNIYALTQNTMDTIALKYANCAILTDCMPLPSFPNAISLVKGDQQSISIAAASILAKVTRDHMMILYDKLYPEYGFASNKGYGTKKHIDAIKQYGVCDIHRLTYGPCHPIEQLTLF